MRNTHIKESVRVARDVVNMDIRESLRVVRDVFNTDIRELEFKTYKRCI